MFYKGLFSDVLRIVREKVILWKAVWKVWSVADPEN